MVTEEMISRAIEKVKRDTITDKHIKITVVGEDPTLSIFDSKFGGIPYLPQDAKVPVDSEGVQLGLLAQVNCSDLPENDLYPKTGLVQFWIGRDDLMGLDEEEGSKVIYYPELDRMVTEMDVLEKYKLFDEDDRDEYSPFEPAYNTLKIAFEEKPVSITAVDYRFEEIFCNAINELYPEANVTDMWTDIDDFSLDKVFNEFSNEGHSIGGYPLFIQEDPRQYDEEKEEYNVMLLQVDSEFVEGERRYLIIWGDCGIANFFIREKDLKAQDFSNILYNWDCS